MTTMAPIQTLKLTVEQYFQLGEDPSGTHMELIDGEIVVSPGANPTHARIVLAITYLLETHVRKHKLGRIYLDTDVIFEPDTARRPDIAFFGRDKVKNLKADRLDIMPDLCVEVLSPGNVSDDRVNKFNLYQTHGVEHYWIVDPKARAAECFALVGGAYKLIDSQRGDAIAHFPPFLDLAMPLAEVWEPGL